MLNSLRLQLVSGWRYLTIRQPALTLFYIVLVLVWLFALLLCLLASLLSPAHPDPARSFSFRSYTYNTLVVPLTQSAAANPVPAPNSATTGGLQHTVEGPPTITAAQIEGQLVRYGSPATGRGQVLYDLGLKYGIDPAYALAFFIHESSAGTRGLATVTLSLGNIRQTAGSGFESYQGFRKYPSWEAGMEDWYRLIKNLYIQGWHLRTVETIIPVYAPAADHNDPQAYIRAVNSLVQAWRKN